MFEFYVNHLTLCNFFKVDVSIKDSPTLNSDEFSSSWICEIKWILRDEIIIWMNDLNISYKEIRYNESYCQNVPKSIIFEKETDAILFKLSWM